MAKIITPLSFAKIKASKPKDKLYKLSDGAGLSLWIYPSGRMRWAFKYREDGKQKNAYLGEYPAYSLSDAREWRESLRRRLERGVQVVEEKKMMPPLYLILFMPIGMKDGLLKRNQKNMPSKLKQP